MNFSKLLLFIVSLITLVFLTVKTMVLFTYIPSTGQTRTIEYVCFLSLIPLIYYMYRTLACKTHEVKEARDYYMKLNESLVSQSNNDRFFDGDLANGTMDLVKTIANTLDVDRTSVWLYEEDFQSIKLQQLYIRDNDTFHQGDIIKKEDYPEYFEAIAIDPVIIADDVYSHPATVCFKSTYTGPLNIQSMLDVPIWYNDQIIGVICIESCSPVTWKKEAIDYAQIISSYYSFAYTVRENKILIQDFHDIEKFIDSATLVSKADRYGKITYVNKRFEEVSGWKLKEVIGKDHSIVNSGEHTKSFWRNMYKVTVKDKRIWNQIVCNRTKNGKLYYVDTYIKAMFDQETGELIGYSSIRQDITIMVKSMNEIEKKNTYLEHAAKILRHDMHSGINTYIPRGISSLERRLSPGQIEQLKIEAPLKMIKEGLKHTQKVYKGVYEFTNLVKKDQVLERTSCNLKSILVDYLSSTAYRQQVIIGDLGELSVNESLFCTAIDNLIRNGLKYNDSDSKIVKVYREKKTLFVEDNGRGLSADDLKVYSQPYSRKDGQRESGTGLGLNICIAILEEHGFTVTCEKLEPTGTKFKINLTK